MATDEEIQAVWNKGEKAVADTGIEWRKDACGAWIERKYHGNRDYKYGWEIDHINPDGGDSISNLRPLHWKNNLEKSDGKLVCKVKSEGKENIQIT